MPGDIAIVDYGSGNVRSIENALKVARQPEQRVVLTADPRTIADAERVVLPGVGAFAECYRKLTASGVMGALTDAVQAGKPFLGICVGMQLLADEGREFEVHRGLGWVPGVVDRLHAGALKLPHVGWTPIRPRPSPLFEGISEGESFYFVHSYVLRCASPDDTAADAEYGEPFVAAVQRKNLFGCQFHPEKSDRAGLTLLKNFCRW